MFISSGMVSCSYQHLLEPHGILQKITGGYPTSLKIRARIIIHSTSLVASAASCYVLLHYFINFQTKELPVVTKHCDRVIGLPKSFTESSQQQPLFFKKFTPSSFVQKEKKISGKIFPIWESNPDHWSENPRS